jgi:hypothetical protein
LPGGRIYCYGLFFGENQIGFQCFANYVPTRKGMIEILHSNRTVIHPDYAGLGMGIKLINLSSAHMKSTQKCKIMAKFSAMPVYRAMIKNNQWKFLGEQRKMNGTVIGGNMDRKSGFREWGIRTFHFEFVGETQ